MIISNMAFFASIYSHAPFPAYTKWQGNESGSSIAVMLEKYQSIYDGRTIKRDK
jgi:hypothetical protein